MTPDQLVAALELERAQLRPGRHMTPPCPDDRPETCAARLAAVTEAAVGVEVPKMAAVRRRAHQRARAAARL